MISCLVFVGCAKPAPTDSAVTGQEPRKVSLWVLAPLAWPWASYGQDVVEVAQRFVDVFEAEQDSIDIDLVVENGACNGKDASAAVQKLIDTDKVLSIVWGVCSSETLAAGAIAQEKWVLMLAPWSASSKVADISDWVVRTNSNQAAAQTLRDAVAPNEYQKIIIVSENKDYPKDMANSFFDVAETNIQRFAFQSDDKDLSILAKQIQDVENADALFVFTQSEATSIPLFKAMDKAWLLETYKNNIFGANNLLVAPFIASFDTAIEGIREVNVVSPTLDYTVDPYMQSLSGYAIQGDGFTLLQAADAMRMVLEAVQRGADSSESIQQYVYDFDEDAPYEGYLGTYWFDERGEAQNIQFGMYVLQDGEKIVVE